MSRKFTIEEVRMFIEQNGNGDILLSKEYFDCHKKVKILCGECKNIYFIRYNNYKEGHRCSTCAHKEIWGYNATKTITKYNNLKACFPELMIEWDYELNNKMPEQYSPYSNYNVRWICKKCGYKYNSIIANRTMWKNGCPLCRDSKIEKQVKIFFSKNNIIFEWQKTFKDCTYKRKLEFDFYICNKSLIIETQGRQHFIPIDFGGRGKDWAIREFNKNQIRDQIKRDYCLKNNIKLLEIPYTKFNKIEEILTHELNL